MAGRHTTLVIIPKDATSVKQFKFSRAFILFAACFSVVCVTAIPYIVYDYCRLKQVLPSTHVLERQVTDQRAQIQVFAKEIDTLKSDMMALQEFEKKIRVVANIGHPAGQDAVFGIGGSMPDDLDASLPLTERHNSLLREMHDQVEHLNEASAVQMEAFGELYEYLQDQKSLLAATPTIRPTTGWTSSRFGYRISPFTAAKEFHQGIDIATRTDTPIVAPADGTVTFVGRKGRLGKTMLIDHGNGMLTRYGHLNKYLVKRGAPVKRGEKIALVGNSGRSTAPHLHYEVHLNGLPVNPKKYILD
jgi:murein DD-endopeptidase MepM/ murein hydrolase activator NlpD